MIAKIEPNDKRHPSNENADEVDGVSDPHREDIVYVSFIEITIVLFPAASMTTPSGPWWEAI
jgi:hypothetical protein